MKLAVFYPKEEFSLALRNKLKDVFESVIYTSSHKEYSPVDLSKLASRADILMVDPDNLGGFEKGWENLEKVLKDSSNLKGIALDTTDTGWINLEYLKKRGISVCNLPSSLQKNSIGEFTIGLIFALAKKVLKMDRKAHEGKFDLEKGVELNGKTLGILGLGNIGSRVAELGLGIGMKVIANNLSPREQVGVKMVSLDELLKKSDVISLHANHSPENKNLIGKSEISKMKDGVMIVNIADRDLVDESAMAEALRTGKVFGYLFEAEDLVNTPLAKVENAIGIKSYGWYTKESLERIYDVWVDNAVSIAKGSPKNLVD